MSITKERAGELTMLIRQHVQHVRVYLYEMYASEGWRVLGYNSWRDYLTQEFSEISYSYLTRQTKAALLEAKVGVEIGTHKEGHLRPITEGLDDDAALEAYRRINFDGSPRAKEVEGVVANVKVMRSPYNGLKFNVRQGLVSSIVGAQILSMLEEITDTELISVAERVSDPDLIPILVRLAKQKSDTWDEIRNSLTIPAFPDPIPLVKANAANLLAWLDVASAEHRAMGRVERQAYYDRLNAATNALVDMMYALSEGSDFDRDKVVELVEAHKEAANEKPTP